MGSQEAQNWIALIGVVLAVLVQAVVLGWWIARKLTAHEIAFAIGLSAEREARARSLSEHARAVAADIEHAKAEARSAKEQVQIVRTEIANAFRDYPARDELRQMLSDRLDPINRTLEKLLPPTRKKSTK